MEILIFNRILKDILLFDDYASYNIVSDFYPNH